MTELTNLHHDQLKDLTKKPKLIDGSDDGLFTGVLTSASPLYEMINECPNFIEVASSEQSKKDNTGRDLFVTQDTKDRTLNELNVKVTEFSFVETCADRIISILQLFLVVEATDEIPYFIG